MEPMENLTITLCGCGAIGCRMAAVLLSAGYRVQGFQRAGAQLDTLKDGFTLTGLPGDHEQRYRFTTISDNPDDLAPTRLIIVLVKTPETKAACALTPILLEDGAVLSLQNGLGNAESLSTCFNEEQIAVGTSTYGGFRIAPGITGWGGDGYVRLGPYRQHTDLSWVADVLARAALTVEYLDDPRHALWTKLALNLMTNPLTALTRRRNGELLEDDGLADLMRALADEAVQAASFAGVTLDSEQLWSALSDTLHRTAGNRSSMLQDVEAGRPTEIDAITGAMLRICPVPLPHTETLHCLIRGVEG